MPVLSDFVSTVRNGASNAANTAFTNGSNAANAGANAAAGAVGNAADAAKDIAEKANKIVTDAVKEVGKASEDVSKAIRKSSDDAANAIRKSAGDAERAITAVQEKARQDIMALLGMVGQLIPALPDLGDASMGTVNGEKFYTPADGYVLLVKAVKEGKNPIRFETHEPAVIAAFSGMLASGRDEFKRKMLDQFLRKYSIPTHSVNNVVGADDAAMAAAIFSGIAACIVATSIPIMAVGVTILLILIGVAFIYALHEGYDIENVELGTGGGADLRPTIKFSLRKHD